MTNTESIYNDLMLHKYLNKAKYLRDSYHRIVGNQNLYGMSFCSNIATPTSNELQFILKECDELTIQMIYEVVLCLCKVYHNDIDNPAFLDMHETQDISYKNLKEHLIWKNYAAAETRKLLVIFHLNGQKKALYIFKPTWPKRVSLLSQSDSIADHFKADEYTYVSLVEENAFCEILNHNDDIHDITRGTKICSLKDFFDKFFPSDEYVLFKKYFCEYKQQLQNYFGLKQIESLRNNTLYSFSNKNKTLLIDYDFSYIPEAAYDISELIDRKKRFLDTPSSSNDIGLIRENLINTRAFEALFSDQDFSQSFKTSEWLYSNLIGDAGSIDLAPISMGYFKSIEQLMYKILFFHTNNSDAKNRKISIDRQIGLVELTEENLKKYSDKLTIGTLGIFYSYSKNSDLFISNISISAIEYIQNHLKMIKDIRNSYFHKDNITSWQKISFDRSLAIDTLFLLLGAIKYSDEELIMLGVKPLNNDADFENLCAYLHWTCQGDFETGGFPIYYFSQNSPKDYYLRAYTDKSLSYDSNGNPNFSGIYLGHFMGKNIKRYQRTDLPSEIYEGAIYMNLDNNTEQLTLEPSGPQRLIYKDGKFLL